uniref:Protein kinase domain-containing protein n=1 Tax=Steinernema glaseri TaxID=37863 RepID=A0A1I8AWB0_9BILA
MVQQRISPTAVIPRFAEGSVVHLDKKALVVGELLALGNRMRVYAVTEGRDSLVLKEFLGSARIADYELETHQAISDHPFVVTFIGQKTVWQDGGRRALTLMERAPYGDLRDVIRDYGRVRPDIAWLFFDQIVAALGHMHRQGCVHAGVHPRNVFAFSPELCKLGDFGNGHPVFYYDPLAKISREESRDLLGAADTLLFLLLGFMPRENEDFWVAFKKIGGPKEARHFLAEWELEEVMTVDDAIYVRQFYNYDCTTRPIPEAYGPLRTSMEH